MIRPRGTSYPCVRQAKLLGFSRWQRLLSDSSGSDGDLALMRRIDELHLDYPLCRKSDVARALERRRSGDRAATRRHADEEDGHQGDLPPPPNTSKPAPGHIRKLAVTPAQSGVGNGPDLHPHGAGICLSVRRRGLFSRKVLSWRLSITMEAAFCIEAVEEALARHGRPEIFNTDQGSQFTSIDFTAVLKRSQIAISMDGKVRGETMSSSRAALAFDQNTRGVSMPTRLCPRHALASPRYLNFYNTRRPHWHCCKVSDDEAPFVLFKGLTFQKLCVPGAFRQGITIIKC